jgi:hypothetical protein
MSDLLSGTAHSTLAILKFEGGTMSEYQYYEWQTVDRALTAAEQAAVGRLSSHIDVSSSRATVTYQWGDFKHDPKQVLVKYFDAHLYLANWGSQRLMFRFPKGLLDAQSVSAYCIEDFITLETLGGYEVLDLRLDEEEGVGWLEGEGDLSTFARLRDDLLQGDYRLLYTAWLKAIELSRPSEKEDDPDGLNQGLEPPVPTGLKHLPEALERFVKAFDVDPYLVKAASETSPDREVSSELDYGALVSRLTREECNDFLARMAKGETGVALALRKRLMAFIQKTHQSAPERRTIQQLFERGKQLKSEEALRRKEAAHRKHAAEMKTLAKNEVQAWQEVETLIQVFTPKGYDEATEKLVKLKQLAEFQGAPGLFEERIQSLSGKYRTRRGLLDRWQKKKLR